jgi:hypothetical protein
VDQYLNNRQNEILWRLLANPADNGNSYGSDLRQLVNDFPQSGLLQALLARADSGGNLPHAAAAYNTKTLFVILNAYENLAEVSEAQIVQQPGGPVNYGVEGQKADSATEPEIHNEEPAEKVVVGDDERHEVETLEFEQDTGEQAIAEITRADNDPLQETQPPSGIITPEGIDEPVALIEEAAEQEPLAEIPAEDELTEISASTYGKALTGSPEIEQPAIEVPPEDHRADADLSPYEEEIIEAPEQEIASHTAEVTPEDNRAEILAPPYEEDVTDLPEPGTIEAHNEHTAGEHIETTPPATDDQPREEEGGHKHYGTFGDIDDEVFEEIADISNISFAFAPKPEDITPVPPAIETPAEEPAAHSADNETGALEHDDTRDEIGRLMSQELVAADYFAFESARQHDPDPEATEEPEIFTAESEIHTQPVGEAVELPQTEPETQNISRYHDEKMPYTFMWWLDKTRREHSGIYQPFKLDITQAIRHTADDTLQQQYYENIFHVSTIDELEKNASKPSVEFDMQDKEDRIIQKFITEEPQIGPPTSDKLDNENKAKKSSEDQDEMVTETLAKIYVDQMLYHKAINTYKKLMLKFPEKSRYFADQVEILERKIN